MLEPELGLGDFWGFTNETLCGHGGGYGTFYGTREASPRGSGGDGAPSILFQEGRWSGGTLPPFASGARFANPGGRLKANSVIVEIAKIKRHCLIPPRVDAVEFPRKIPVLVAQFHDRHHGRHMFPQFRVPQIGSQPLK